MAAEAGDTAPDSPTRRLLIKQEQLIEAQIRLARLEWRGRWLANVRDLALMLGVVSLLAAAGAVIWSAATSRSVVVESFETPAIWNDNYFDLLPGESRTLSIAHGALPEHLWLVAGMGERAPLPDTGSVEL